MSTSRPPRQRAPHPVDRVGYRVVEEHRVELRSQLAGLDPGHVEQVRDEPIEVDRLAIDRLGDWG